MNDMSNTRDLHGGHKEEKAVALNFGHAIVRGFVRGLWAMPTLGLDQRIPHLALSQPAAVKLASDWTTVGRGLNRSARTAKQRVGR